MYNQNMGYNTTTTGQDMSSYSVQASVPHYQPGLMVDNNGMPYSNQIGPQMDNTQSRGYVAMDHSPSLEQTGGFTTVNGPYTPVNQQQGYHSYPNSSSTLSPDPSSFASGPPQMAGFQAHSLASNQQAFVTSPQHAPAQQPFASSPNHAPSYPPQQIPGFADENIYNNQILQQTHNGLGYDQMGMGLRGQGGVVYPPTTNGGYSFHQQ
jgi:hypothetical protein